MRRLPSWAAPVTLGALTVGALLAAAWLLYEALAAMVELLVWGIVALFVIGAAGAGDVGDPIITPAPPPSQHSTP